jgi:hypothetical protein
MSEINRSIRLSQAVSTFGVGAIYDILGESLVLCDTTYWRRDTYKGRGRRIKAQRLVDALRASGIMITSLYEPRKRLSEHRSAKIGQLLYTLPFMRFPRWLFCSNSDCRRMKKWTYDDEKKSETPVCPSCRKRTKLTPMRFIRICDHGHMADVPWEHWAHSKTTTDAQKTCRSENLLFKTAFDVKTSGLESVAIECADCGASRNLGGITAPKALEAAGIKCSGKQPWQSPEAARECARDQRVVQRGAGNVYYPKIRSAITIPPESNYQVEDADLTARIKEDSLYIALGQQTGNEGFKNMLIERLCDMYDCKPIDILRLLHPEQHTTDASDSIDKIEQEEWCALTESNPEQDDRDSFVTKHITLPKTGAASDLSKLIDKVVSVIKLREVRVLTEFYRYQPGDNNEGSESRPTSPDIGRGEDWLPATEVFGEGIFITLNETELQKWERRDVITARVKVLKERRTTHPFAPLLPAAVPRFVLLHTLAHILIRRLAFECGYASASLRERIYCQIPNENDARAGILIYTAAGDAEGTLGGLSRQAEVSRLTSTVLAALQDAAWCSTDPICIESEGQGLGGLNLASCHACSLVAETSCESFNLLLDRALIVGDGANIPGFFEPVLTSALEASTTHAAAQ